MTLSKNSNDIFFNTSSFKTAENSSRWSSLYSSQLWANSPLRKAVLDKHNNAQCVPKLENENTQDCLPHNRRDITYEFDFHRNHYFVPNNHSTPIYKNISNGNNVIENEILDENRRVTSNEANVNEVAIERNGHPIPSISHRVDSSFRHKFSSSEVYNERRNKRNKIRKCGVKGIGCIVSLAITDTPIKKRTQIQACSISIMIMTILLVSFVLVNFTSLNYKSNLSTLTVPTQPSEHNNTSSITTIDTTTQTLESITADYTTTNIETDNTEATESSHIYEIIKKIRKNIRTYPKDFNKIVAENNEMTSQKLKEINNRDLSQRFCKCQMDEVCMLDEDTGKSLCKVAHDINDPTGNFSVL